MSSARDLDQWDEIQAHGDGEDGGIGESPHYRPGRQWTVTVSAGRNVGREPMDDDRWADFRTLLYLALRAADVVVFFGGEGTGEYDGQTEQAATFVGAVVRRPDPVLEDELASLAREFEQESIAVTYGETVLVGPSTRTEV